LRTRWCGRSDYWGGRAHEAKGEYSAKNPTTQDNLPLGTDGSRIGLPLRVLEQLGRLNVPAACSRGTFPRGRWLLSFVRATTEAFEPNVSGVLLPVDPDARALVVASGQREGIWY
jgi:hypothetical protein